jgi:hypothetical protein
MPDGLDGELLERFVQGDQAAFESLFRQFEADVPMAIVPNLWGLWNMLWVAAKSRTHLPVAVHGSLLPLFLVPSGILLGRTLELFHLQLSYALPAIPVGMTLYYLAWKFLVGSLNREMGIA